MDRIINRRPLFIVIIGFGHYGRCILERAILTNIISVKQHVAYHIFGDAKAFLAMHAHLSEMFSVGNESGTTDSLIFHDEFWEADHAILSRADRIIICTDDEPEGWNIFWRLHKYYNLRGHIDLHSNRKALGVSYFGTNDILMKIRILLKDETITEFTADTTEKAYQKYCETKSTESIQDWYRRLDHMRWLRFYTFYNWSFGPVRDDAARQHPMLCPYDRLTPEQKKERDASWELLGQIR